MRERQPSVEVGVFDQDRQSLKDARVRLESDQVGGKSYDLSSVPGDVTLPAA
jgi:hypothetical protein